MAYYEIDMVEAGENDSGDAIVLRYDNNLGQEIVHVVDGGYESSGDGQKLLNIIQNQYIQKNLINHVVLTHPDRDHASGLKQIIEQEAVAIGILWMNRPWMYVDALLPHFPRFTRDGLIRKLREDYPHTAELEQLANERAVPILIRDAFQGAEIGSFRVLAPTRDRYLRLIIDAEREAGVVHGLLQLPRRVANIIRGNWGQENLTGDTVGTSPRNEMSIVQYTELAGHRILLTGDTGINGLHEAHQYLTALGVQLPGIHLFQVPHHGARRNLTSDILNRWLGPILENAPTAAHFNAMISANGNDEDHPRKSVRRALWHRGGGVKSTKAAGHVCWPYGVPMHPGYATAPYEPYPLDMEE